MTFATNLKRIVYISDPENDDPNEYDKINKIFKFEESCQDIIVEMNK